MVEKAYEIALSVAVFQYLLMAVFLLTHKKRQWLSNRILAGFLISKTLSLTSLIFYFFRYPIWIHCPHLFFIGGSFVFLEAPLLYLYTKSMTHRDIRFKKSYILHFTPFFIDTIHRTFQYHIHSADVKRELLRSGAVIFSYHEVLIRDIAFYVQFIGYVVTSLVVLRIYRTELKKKYSSIERINLSWLSFVLYGFITINSIGFLVFVHEFVTGGSNLLLSLTIKISFVAFSVMIVYKGLSQPEIFSGFHREPLRQKYEKSLLNQLDRRRYLKTLRQVMETEKPYLDSSLSLKDLSKKTSIPSHHLSQVLNDCLDQNFFDFVNKYRIEECKRILSKQSGYKTILEVLYNTGFNTKSVFNRVFKKHTGMTPTEFVKSKSSS